MIAPEEKGVSAMQESFGFVALGKSYLDSARYLEVGISGNALRLLFDNPVDLLLAHAVELMLKGCILEHDPNCAVEKYGHNLLRLYDAARGMNAINGLIEAAEEKVRSRWRKRLRTARDEWQSCFGLSGEYGREFGIFDNSEIEAALPALDLREQIKWVNDQHAIRGSLFRYPKSRMEQRPDIKTFGLQDDVVRLSIGWGCDEIYARFVANFQRAHPPQQ